MIGHIPELEAMKKYPQTLHAAGNQALLKRPKISIVGMRKPNQYTQQTTMDLASKLSRRGVCIVSGGAMGVDAVAHKAAGAHNTIAVLPCGISHRYPSVNAKLLASIEAEGLILSPFEPAFKATNWSFVVRNELVVALGEVLIVTQADAQSGSMRSVEYAHAMGKPVYVLPHRLGESEGTQRLLAEGKATAIYDIDAFAAQFGENLPATHDPFLSYCALHPSYEEAVKKYGNKVFESELMGDIEVHNGVVYLVER